MAFEAEPARHSAAAFAQARQLGAPRRRPRQLAIGAGVQLDDRRAER